MRRRALLVLAAAAALATQLSAGDARANGRFPAAGQVIFDPSDDARVYVRATYGLARSDDRGASWSWICEASIGFTGLEDPQIAVMDDGALVAGISAGLSTTRDHGCSFAFAPGDAGTTRIVDVARTLADPSRVVALGVLASPKRFVVLESVDAGRSFSVIGNPLPAEVTFGATIDLAASDPSRVYVSGSAKLGDAGVDGVVLRSSNRGASWATTPLHLGTDVPYIAAVDRADADVVWVRVDADVTDSLWRSHDGAASFEKVFDSAGDLLGFAISADGTKLAIGGPSDGVLVAPLDGGAPTSAPTKKSALGAKCLSFHGAELWACADESVDGFSAGKSTDDGATFATTYAQRSLTLSTCDATTTTGAKCPADWPALAGRLGIDAGVVPVDASADDAPADDASPDVSLDGAGGSAGFGGSAQTATGDSTGSSGCSVTSRDTKYKSSFISLFSMVVSFAAIRRSRKRRPRP